MKYGKFILKYALLAVAALGFVACEDDEPSSESIFSEETALMSDFDAWLMRHYVEPFNIRFEYRMPDRETNFGYWVSPPPVHKAIEIAKSIKFGTIDTMIEMMSNGVPGEDPTLFVKTYFPKQLFIVGNHEVSNTGTVVLGSAENGLKINIFGAKYFDRENPGSVIGLLLHEFTHILDGTYPVPSEFRQITPNDYVGSRYTSLGGDYLQLGFISNYGRSSVAEDIAEIGGRAVSATDEEWEEIFRQAGEEGAAKLRQKRQIIRDWLMNSFGVDADKWVRIYQRRMKELKTIDWDNLED